MNAFTAGPWSIGTPNCNHEHCASHSKALGVESSEWNIADVYGDVPDLDMRANANLIAAAPEMYEALKALVADCSDYEPWQRPCLAFDNAKAALAKAEGG